MHRSYDFSLTPNYPALGSRRRERFQRQSFAQRPYHESWQDFEVLEHWDHHYGHQELKTRCLTKPCRNQDRGTGKFALLRVSYLTLWYLMRSNLGFKMDSRAHRRISVDKEIQCQMGNHSDWVVLYDLSCSGAMIEIGKLNIGVGDDIQLNLHDVITATGQIAWKIDGSAGVKFHGILSDSILEHLGFSSSSLAFDEQHPRSRLGEILFNVEPGSAQMALESAPEANTPPTDWLDSAKLQEDRRRSDRGDESRRKEDRLALSARAKLCKSIREGVEGRMVDLSTKGCSFVDTTNSFQPGDEVWLKMEALELWRGTVRWVKDEKVGIEFERPFYPAVLNHLVELHRDVVVSRAA